jgi:hypothetical protein
VAVGRSALWRRKQAAKRTCAEATTVCSVALPSGEAGVSTVLGRGRGGAGGGLGGAAMLTGVAVIVRVGGGGAAGGGAGAAGLAIGSGSIEGGACGARVRMATSTEVRKSATPTATSPPAATRTRRCGRLGGMYIGISSVVGPSVSSSVTASIVAGGSRSVDFGLTTSARFTEATLGTVVAGLHGLLAEERDHEVGDVGGARARSDARQRRLQRERHLAGGVVALVALAGQRAAQDRRHALRQVLPEGERVRHLVLEDGVHGAHLGLALEGVPLGEERVEGDAEAEDVAAVIDREIADLLRREIGELPLRPPERVSRGATWPWRCRSRAASPRPGSSP